MHHRFFRYRPIFAENLFQWFFFKIEEFRLLKIKILWVREQTTPFLKKRKSFLFSRIPPCPPSVQTTICFLEHFWITQKKVVFYPKTAEFCSRNYLLLLLNIRRFHIFHKVWWLTIKLFAKSCKCLMV